MDGASELVHATAIALGAKVALLRGPPGSGKSDLALRCLAQPPGPLVPEPALLVSDDQVRLTAAGGRLTATAPETIRGMIEVRGLGLLRLDCIDSAEVRLVVQLVSPEAIERLPDPGAVVELCGVRLPLLLLAPFQASAPLKLLLALYRA